MSHDLLKIQGLSLVDFFCQKNPLQDLLSRLNAAISTNESTQFITRHMVHNLAYTEILQTTTTLILLSY